MHTPFHSITITYKVAVYAPAERADKLPVFHLYPYMYSVHLTMEHSVKVGNTQNFGFHNVHVNAQPMSDSRNGWIELRVFVKKI